jgi:cytochrome c oxidase subunit IV
MTRILKTSGFLGLTTMMLVGMYQHSLVAGGGGAPGWMVGGHAHLGVLSILAIVMGFAVDAFALTGTLRTAVTGLFLVGQWLLPVSVWVGAGFGITLLLPAIFLWGLCLVAAMLVMAWQAATTDLTSGGSVPGVAPADD